MTTFWRTLIFNWVRRLGNLDLTVIGKAIIIFFKKSKLPDLKKGRSKVNFNHANKTHQTLIDKDFVFPRRF